MIQEYKINKESFFPPEVLSIDVYQGRDLKTTIDNPGDYNKKKLMNFLRNEYGDKISFVCELKFSNSSEAKKISFKSPEYLRRYKEKIKNKSNPVNESVREVNNMSDDVKELIKGMTEAIKQNAEVTKAVLDNNQQLVNALKDTQNKHVDTLLKIMKDSGESESGNSGSMLAQLMQIFQAQQAAGMQPGGNGNGYGR